MGKRGIDVSSHNGALDWGAIRSAGISFAILRAGYGRYAVDDRFYENIRGALAQGIPMGVYWFSYALNEASARQEAKKCLETISGFDVTLPVFYDFEYDTVRYGKDNGVSLGKTEFNAFSLAFLGEIEAAGYAGGIYYNLDYYRTMVDTARLGKYPVWFAQYAASPSLQDCAIWQYTASGSVSGVSGSFDLNELLDESLLTPRVDYTPGWHRNDTGWWYVRQDGTYPAEEWEKIDGIWYYFNASGYMLAEQWVVTDGNAYYLDADGAMVSERSVYIDSGGRLVPGGRYYHTLGQVSGSYREALEGLIREGLLFGKSGQGDELVLDLSEETVRALAVLWRSLQK